MGSEIDPEAVLFVLGKLEAEAFVEELARSTGVIVLITDPETGARSAYGPFTKQDGFVADEFMRLMVAELNDGGGGPPPFEGDIIMLFDPADGPLTQARVAGEARTEELHSRINGVIQRRRQNNNDGL